MNILRIFSALALLLSSINCLAKEAKPINFSEYTKRDSNSSWSFYRISTKKAGPHNESSIYKEYDYTDDVLCYTLHPDKWKSGYGSSGKGYFAGNHVGVMTCVQPNKKLEAKLDANNAKLDKIIQLLEKIANKP